MRLTSYLFLAFSAVACNGSQGVQLQPKTTDGNVTGGTTTTNTTTTTTDTQDTGTTQQTTRFDYDCSQPLPSVPVSFDTLHDYSDAEDFDFDASGYAIAEYSSNLTGKDQQGNVEVISPNIGSWTAGTRVLATGDYVVAVPGEGTVKRIDASTGAKSSILSGLSYPNGLEVDRDNNVYVADQTTQKILRVNAYDQSDYEVIATGLSQPNGVILSPDETILYVGSFGGGKIYAIDRDPGGTGWLPHRTIFDSGGGDHGYDGINVDICGNVYFTEYIVGRVRRVTPDGSQVDGVADLPSSWIPNLRWGNGIGGWEVDVLYVSDRDQGRLFALDMGIPGKKHVLIP